MDNIFIGGFSDYSPFGDFEPYTILSAQVDENSARWEIPYCGGTLVCEKNSDNTITLRDFIGEVGILMIPATITINGVPYDVNPHIPDLAFSSCQNIKYLVVGFSQRVRFGTCVFQNCGCFSAVLCLYFHEDEWLSDTSKEPKIEMDENSFCGVNPPQIRCLILGCWHEFYAEYVTNDDGRRDCRWLAELSGRLEQVIIYCAEKNALSAFQRLLIWAQRDVELSVIFSWEGLRKSAFGNGEYYATEHEDEVLYHALCQMQPLKSDKYYGHWWQEDA